jgi:hypothetical protein
MLIAQDGRSIVGAAGDKIIFGTFKGGMDRTLQGELGTNIAALAFAPGMQFLASGDEIGTVMPWEFEK